MTVSVLAALLVVANGIALGIMLSTVIGIVPYMLAQPYEGYVRMVKFLWPRFDPVMPALNGSVLLADIVAAALARTDAQRAGFAVAAGLLAVVMGISVTKNVPINRFVTSLNAATEPTDWPRLDPRRRWRQWNLYRTSVALVAFVVNVLTVMAIR